MPYDSEDLPYGSEEWILAKCKEQGIPIPPLAGNYAIDLDGNLYERLPSGKGWSPAGRKNLAAATTLQKAFMPVPQAKAITGRHLYEVPTPQKPPLDLAPPLVPRPIIPKHESRGGAWFLAFTALAVLVAVIVLLVKFAGRSDTPSNVMASPLSKYKIRVSWTNNLKNATGFHLDNGCPAGACGGHGATLAKTAARVTSTIFRVTPGAYECFRVQAFSKSTTTGWSSYGCTSTPSLNMYATQAWRRTDVILHSGDRLVIKASGQLSVGSSRQVYASGKPSCTPAVNHASTAADYPAPHLPCLSLIARIGNHHPVEVGNSVSLITPRGRLYLGVNGRDFSGSAGAWTVNINIGGAPSS
jgi:hypothetical protein